MNPIDTYIAEVVNRIPPFPDVRERARQDLRAHLDDAVMNGTLVAKAIQEMGTPEEIAAAYSANIQYVYPSLWRRVGAYAIDVGVVIFGWIIILLLLALALGWPLSPDFINSLSSTKGAQLVSAGLGIILVYLMGLAYPSLSEWQAGRTIGKWCMGLSVIRTNGAPIDLLRALGRHLPWLVTFPSFGLITLEALWALTNKRRQRACDVLADTVVIQTSSRIAVERIIVGFIFVMMVVLLCVWMTMKLAGSSTPIGTIVV